MTDITSELRYAQLLQDVLEHGQKRKTRNGITYAVFGGTLHLYDVAKDFPIIKNRKMYLKGILGEYAAFVRGPKNVEDFKKWGCNYWDKFADEEGKLVVDYGNKWLDFNGVNQWDALIDGLKNNHNGRRHMLVSWDPSNLDNVTLPCCHYSYQFYVESGRLYMLWTQRSVDMAIGLPSDMVLAATMLMDVADKTGLEPASVFMTLGDCHIYEEHLDGVREYLDRAARSESLLSKTIDAKMGSVSDVFTPDMLTLSTYESLEPISFELKV